MASETDVIMLCGHCGNQTAFEEKGTYSRNAHGMRNELAEELIVDPEAKVMPKRTGRLS